jgi:hypothetical protein
MTQTITHLSWGNKPEYRLDLFTYILLYQSLGFIYIYFIVSIAWIYLHIFYHVHKIILSYLPHIY